MSALCRRRLPRAGWPATAGLHSVRDYQRVEPALHVSCLIACCVNRLHHSRVDLAESLAQERKETGKVHPRPTILRPLLGYERSRNTPTHQCVGHRLNAVTPLS